MMLIRRTTMAMLTASDASRSSAFDKVLADGNKSRTTQAIHCAHLPLML
jgi:hypothetical protein